jgi:hypothetical protein
MTAEKKRNSILPDYSTTGGLALKNQNTLRRLVGILGILLPLLVYLFLQLTSNFDLILPSISHYYFTRAASIFEIIVSLLAIFLLIYKGEKLVDYILSSVAGISALLMLIFPTSNLRGFNGTSKYDSIAVTFFHTSLFRPKFHYACAALFLLSLALMALFLFTKSSDSPSFRTRNKKIRNKIYRICGVAMLAALCVAFLGFVNVIQPNFYDANNLTFWMEVVAVEAFGIAWMVKGELVLADK